MRFARTTLATIALLAEPSAFALSQGEADEAAIQTYDVSGSTFRELIVSMQRNAPFVERTGQRHFGVTEVGFRPSWSVKPSPGSCELVEANVAIELTIVVPRWIDRANASPRLQERWDALRDDIVRHEEQHAAIARTYLARMRAELDRPIEASNCDTLNAKLTGRAQAISEQHRAAQRAFDQVVEKPVPKSN